MYITFDGPEATGKSTQAKKLKDYLQAKGYKVLLTREPGSKHNSTCEEIRKILLSPTFDPCDKTSLLLFLADRAQHITRVIKPALEYGLTVISDRSSLSTLVYHMATLPQPWVSDFELEHLPSMLNFAQYIRPDVGFVSQGDVEWSISRMKGLDRIESKGEEFHRKVHHYFRNLDEAPTALSNQLFWPKSVFLLPSIPKCSEKEVAEFIIETEERERKK